MNIKAKNSLIERRKNSEHAKKIASTPESSVLKEKSTVKGDPLPEYGVFPVHSADKEMALKQSIFVQNIPNKVSE